MKTGVPVMTGAGHGADPGITAPSVAGGDAHHPAGRVRPGIDARDRLA